MFGGSAVITPTNYGNANAFIDNFSIVGGKYPSTDIAKDNYQIWLRQNALNLGLGVVGGVAEGVWGGVRLGSGDMTGLVNLGSSLGSIFNVWKENYLHSRIPITSSGIVNVGDLQLALKLNHFTFTQMSIKEEYARKIDKFFSMYGYKTNDVKTPNITGRLNWNYVKTIGAIVESTSVPDKYLNEYKEMLNNGITFWHNSSTFLDYSQSNSIV